MSIDGKLAVLAGLTYFIGAVPFGLVISRLKGRDPRQFGSGNIGATNVGRMLGGKYFAIVFILDMLKGMLPMLAGAWLVADMSIGDKPYLMWMLVGAAALVGHLFPVYLKFKGGKGVATAAGVLMGLWPYYTLPGLVVIGLFVLIFMIWRMVSLGSVVGSLAFAPVYAGFGVWRGWPILEEQFPLLLFAIAMSVLISWKHRSNIRRILAGTESRFRKKGF